MQRFHPLRARAGRVIGVFVALLVIAAQHPVHSIEASPSLSAAPLPPVGGRVIAVAGVGDVEQLIASAPFTVASVSTFSVEAQQFATYVPGAPAFINADLAEHLHSDTIVWITRGAGPTRTVEGQSVEAPPGLVGPQHLAPPPRGGLTAGRSGTSSVDALVATQPFDVGAVFLFDVERQRFLTYLPGAPRQVNTLLDAEALEPDSIVWMRRSPADTTTLIAADAPRFAGASAVQVTTVPTTTAAQPDGLFAPAGTSGGSGSGSGGTSPEPPPLPTATATPTPSATGAPSAGTRDPFLWPFSATSPWNHPIGSGARFTSASDSMSRTIRGEASGARINVTNWAISVFRAEGPEREIRLPSGEVIARVRVPDSARPTPPLVPGDCDTGGLRTEGWADAHMNLVTSDRVLELYGTKRLCDGNLETKYGPWWNDIRGSGIGSRPGAHIGSRAYGGSSLGGLIRKWELEAGEIRHALAAGLPASRFQSGPVWPATSQDGFHATNYRGNVPMGTLAALPPDFDIDSISYSSPYGRALAKAMQDFGIYMVDSSGSAGMTLYGEPSVAELPNWQQINDDLKRLVSHLLPVTNNRADNIGGGGTPRAPMAPPFE